MEKLADIELSNIKVQTAERRNLSSGDAVTCYQEDDVDTLHGPVHVSIQGDQHKPAILTFHDIGLTGSTCFQGFFNHSDMVPVLQHFCIYHVTAPGQLEGAMTLPHGALESRSMKQSESEHLLDSSPLTAGVTPDTKHPRRSSLGYNGHKTPVDGYVYPSMDQLAELLMAVIEFYGLKRIIGFGVGAGANVLARFALQHPSRLDGVVLINCTAGRAGWTEWAYQKVNLWHLRGGNISSAVDEYMLWHWLGSKTMSTNHDLVQVYSKALTRMNPTNLAHFIDSYVRRTDLGIVRELDPNKKHDVCMIRCPVMLVSGDYAGQLNDTVNMNGRLDPTTSSWMKFECGGMILEEAPNKLAEAFRLFLQGLGYVSGLNQLQLLESRAGPNRVKPAATPAKPANEDAAAAGGSRRQRCIGRPRMLIQRALSQIPLSRARM